MPPARPAVSVKITAAMRVLHAARVEGDELKVDLAEAALNSLLDGQPVTETLPVTFVTPVTDKEEDCSATTAHRSNR